MEVPSSARRAEDELEEELNAVSATDQRDKGEIERTVLMTPTSIDDTQNADDDDIIKIIAMRAAGDQEQQRFVTKSGIEKEAHDRPASKQADAKNNKAGKHTYVAYLDDHSSNSAANMKERKDPEVIEDYIADAEAPSDSTDIEAPSLRRNQNKRRNQSLQASSTPGAFSAGGTTRGGSSSSSSSVDSSSVGDDGLSNPAAADDNEEGPREEDNNNGLAVAKIVNPEEEQHPHDLPQATEHTITPNQSKTRKTIGFATLSLLVVLVVIAVPSSLVAKSRKDESEGDDESALPSSSPSTAPSPLTGRLSALLPEYTLQSIWENPDSPQALAWEWLQEDHLYNPFLTNDRIIQRFALATIFKATGGEQWLSNDYWLNHIINECEWYSFRNSRPMLELYGWFFRQYHPHNPEPPPRCNKGGLFEHLWLDRNQLVGVWPLEAYLLTSLKTLFLVRNQLQGPIPSHVGKLTSLYMFNVDNLQNGGVVPSEIGLLTNLRRLSISLSGLTGTLPSQMAKLSKMEGIYIGYNRKLGGKIPDMTHMQELKWVLFGANNHTGTLPQELPQLQELQMIAFLQNRVTGTIPSELGLLKKLEMTSLSGNRLNGSIPTQLGLLTSTTLMTLSFNQLFGQVPSQVGLLTNLSVSLTLSYNPYLGGSIPTQIGALTSLYDLSFANNNHTGHIPSELGELSLVGRLDLRNNSLEGHIPKELASLHQHVYYFDARDNPSLSGTIPESLCNPRGTCMPHLHRSPCTAGSQMEFDCTTLLCGCNCSCSSMQRSTINGT